jgi:hypothetical protein
MAISRGQIVIGLFNQAGHEELDYNFHDAVRPWWHPKPAACIISAKVFSGRT